MQKMLPLCTAMLFHAQCCGLLHMQQNVDHANNFLFTAKQLSIEPLMIKQLKN